MKHLKLSNCKGITMVSLVVTIIVLLILASIGIMAVTGDNGILSSSIRAKNEAEQSSKNIVENEQNFIGDINQGYSGTEAGKNIFSIEYDNNGGEGGPQKQNATTDGDSVNITITETEPTKENSTFIGWSENKDATTPEYEPGKSYEIAENKILYAVYVSNKGNVTINPNGGKWRNSTSTYEINGIKDQKVTLDNPTPPAGYTVTFNGNGGSNPAAQTTTKSFTSWTLVGAGSIDGSTYTFGIGKGELTANYIDNAITLPSIEVTGFTFLGWYDAPSGGNKVGEANGKYTATKSITLYAHWKRNSYTLTINPNGGTWNGKTDTSSITQEFNSTLTIQNPTPPNDYTVTFKPQNSTNDIVLSADRVFSGWSNDGPGVLNGTTYTFKAGNGTLTANYTTSSISLPSVSTTGFTFLGWYDSASGGSKVGDIGGKYVPTGNITLYGHWKRNSYTLTVNPNGGTWNGSTSNSTFTQEYNSTKTIANPTVPAGYKVTFNGNGGSTPSAITSTKSFTSWSKSGSGTLSGTTFTFGAGNTTLTANYKNNSITLPTPTRTGYTFSGWYDSASGGNKIGNGGATYTPTKAITLYAHWNDTTAPTMGTLTKNPTGWTKGNVTLTGKARDLGSGISAYQFSTNSGLTASSAGWTSITKTTNEITKTYTATSNATYYFYVKDESGNINKKSIVVNNIDRTVPTSSISAGSVSNKSVTITAKGSDSQSGVASYKFYVGGKLVSTQTTTAGSATYKYTTTFGSVTAYVIVTDAVGNTKQSSTITIWDYTIKTLAELKTFRDRVNNGTTYKGNTITQIADINIGGSSAGNWTPIGTNSHRFAGTYNGNNHTISNLYIKHSSGNVGDRGLFGNTETGSVIKNLKMTNANVYSNSEAIGILVGYNRSNISSITISSGTLTSYWRGGGICGYNAGGTITSCSNNAKITYIGPLTNGKYNGWSMGGIVGDQGSGTIDKCINTGAIYGTHGAGGILGGGHGIVQNSVNKGSITCTEVSKEDNSFSMIGGIVGFAGWDSTITIANCYNTGSISSIWDAGGIVGDTLGGGGTANIKNCYNIGTVKGTQAQGGVISQRNSGGTLNLSNNYWLSTCGPSNGIAWDNVLQRAHNNNMTPKTATQLKNLAGTLGSAFKKDTSNKNNGYPILSWQ